MIHNAPTIANGGPARVLVLREWFKILIQVTGPGTVFLGTNKDEAGRITQGIVQDGIQLNAANATVPFDLWWKGELWAAGSDPGVQFVIIVPGLIADNKDNTCADAMSYQD
jgi:hypothetical protein